MHILLICADVVMGLILGLFLFAAVSRTWDSFRHPIAAAVILAAAVVLVLFRRPSGSLARRNHDGPSA